jgi:hypothetical protein
MARRKKKSKARGNPFTTRKHKRGYATREGRFIRHASDARSAASAFLLERKRELASGQKPRARKKRRAGGWMTGPSAAFSLRMGGEPSARRGRTKAKRRRATVHAAPVPRAAPAPRATRARQLPPPRARQIDPWYDLFDWMFRG